MGNLNNTLAGIFPRSTKLLPDLESILHTLKQLGFVIAWFGDRAHQSALHPSFPLEVEIYNRLFADGSQSGDGFGIEIFGKDTTEIRALIAQFIEMMEWKKKE